MNVEKPIQVGVSEKAINNPPIEILVENEATLAHLPTSWPVGTVAYTPGREKQWRFNASGSWEAIEQPVIPDFDIDTPSAGDTLVYDGVESKWVNDTRALLLATETADDSTLLSEKWQDILAAYVAGKAVVLYDSEEKTAYGLSACYKSGDDYVVEINAAEGAVAKYIASAADKKPVYTAPEG